MKLWRGAIEQHIEQWSARLGNRGWWPRYAYHFTDVNNATKIIRAGYIYSRSECKKQGLMVVDNASPEIIQNTRPEYFDFVRLYFRPKTPTQFNNEGIRPIGKRKLGGAHCAIPIFFCFDALELLSQDDTQFSIGSMARDNVLYSGEQELFEQIPFNYVFHNGSFTQDQKDTIIFHRHAEVLVPNSLPLSPSLRFIACRTSAERQTLIHLLPANIRRSWLPKIRIADLDLFERKWVFIEEVVVVDDVVTFRFNPNTIIPGPFEVKVEYRENGSDIVREWHGIESSLKETLNVRIPDATSGRISLYLDDSLAFSDTVLFDVLPF